MMNQNNDKNMNNNNDIHHFNALQSDQQQLSNESSGNSNDGSSNGRRRIIPPAPPPPLAAPHPSLRLENICPPHNFHAKFSDPSRSQPNEQVLQNQLFASTAPVRPPPVPHHSQYSSYCGQPPSTNQTTDGLQHDASSQYHPAYNYNGMPPPPNGGASHATHFHPSPIDYHDYRGLPATQPMHYLSGTHISSQFSTSTDHGSLPIDASSTEHRSSHRYLASQDSQLVTKHDPLVRPALPPLTTKFQTLSAADSCDQKRPSFIDSDECAPPLKTIQPAATTNDNYSEITSTPSTRERERERTILGRLPHDFMPPTAQKINTEFCKHRWEYAYIFESQLKDVPCPDNGDNDAIKAYRKKLLKFHTDIKTRLEEGLVELLLKFCSDKNITKPLRHQKASDITKHIFNTCRLYDVDKGMIDMTNLSLILTSSIIVYTCNTSWVSACIQKIETQYELSIEHQQNHGGNFVYKILSGMKVNAADIMRRRMVKHHGICWYEKKSSSTRDLFGAEAVVESGDRLQVHCGPYLLKGFMYRKTGVKVCNPVSSLEYKLGARVKQLLENDEEETFQTAMTTMWQVGISHV